MDAHDTMPAAITSDIQAPNSFSASRPARQDAEAAAAYSPVNATQPMMNKASFTMEGMRDVATL